MRVSPLLRRARFPSVVSFEVGDGENLDKAGALSLQVKLVSSSLFSLYGSFSVLSQSLLKVKTNKQLFQTQTLHLNHQQSCAATLAPAAPAAPALDALFTPSKQLPTVGGHFVSVFVPRVLEEE